MRAIMKEQGASKTQSKQDRNHGIKHVNESKREPIVWKSLLLHLQAAKTKMAPATMSCKLAMWHIYLISTVSAEPAVPS